MSSQSFEVKFLNRVATDLENLEKSGNLKKTSESQGICPKVRKFATDFQKSGNILSEIHFQPS